MWGKELVRLQADYPDISEQVEYAEAFKDWDASTGFHLPSNEQIVRIVCRLTGKASVKSDSKTKPKPAITPKKKTVSRKSLF